MPKYDGPEFAHCDRCLHPAGQLLLLADRTETALCFLCWQPVKEGSKVLHWINRYGRIMFAPGATRGPFRIKHP